MDLPSREDGFKWFGEGFDGFPKRLPEDCVEYLIFAIDAKLDASSALRARLSEISRVVTQLKKQHLKDYIWQRGEFDVKLSSLVASQESNDPGDITDEQNIDQTAKALPHLRGRTNYGDSIADEWLIIYLLLELSKKCSDAWIQIYDTDGEFLLIEAATALPKWLNPDIAENRVWINNGHLRLIPLNETPNSRNLSLNDAHRFIRTKHDRLIISPFVEDEAFFRLREYPTAIPLSLHTALVSIPRRLAFLLRRIPSSITSGVDAFYLRDSVSLKPLATKDISTLHFPPEDFVTVSCKFTRVSFAQLRGQVFDPPPAWTAVIPRMTDPKAVSGMKLTCGFEILLSDPQSQDKTTIRELKLLLDDIDEGHEFLPDDTQIASWPQDQGDDKWLDIDYAEFDKELSGKGRKGENSDTDDTGFGDRSGQDNLRKMVSRFEDFLNDEDAGVDGVDSDPENSSDSDLPVDSEDDAEVQTNDKNINKEEFERAMRETRDMSPAEVQKSGLLEEARRLAIEDAEDQSDVDEDEEMRKVMELMERELKGHGALNLDGGNNSKQAKSKGKAKLDTQITGTQQKPFFGPIRPPHMRSTQSDEESADEEISDMDVGPGDGELSSDDEEFNDIDLTLAKNMLESFKGQAGLAGPAGNLMRSMGVNMPRDEDDVKH